MSQCFIVKELIDFLWNMKRWINEILFWLSILIKFKLSQYTFWTVDYDTNIYVNVINILHLIEHKYSKILNKQAKFMSTLHLLTYREYRRCIRQPTVHQNFWSLSKPAPGSLSQSHFSHPSIIILKRLLNAFTSLTMASLLLCQMPCPSLLYSSQGLLHKISFHSILLLFPLLNKFASIPK